MVSERNTNNRKLKLQGHLDHKVQLSMYLGTMYQIIQSSMYKSVFASWWKTWVQTFPASSYHTPNCTASPSMGVHWELLGEPVQNVFPNMDSIPDGSPIFCSPLPILDVLNPILQCSFHSWEVPSCDLHICHSCEVPPIILSNWSSQL